MYCSSTVYALVWKHALQHEIFQLQHLTRTVLSLSQYQHTSFESGSMSRYVTCKLKLNLRIEQNQCTQKGPCMDLIAFFADHDVAQQKRRQSVPYTWKKTELQSPLRVKTRLIEPRQWQCKETCILYADVSSKNCGRRNIIGTPVLSSVFFAQNNFTVVIISMQKVRVQKISLIWSCQVLNHLTKLFPIKIKTLFQKPWKPYVL